MSKIGLNEGPQKLINQFLMSKYSCAYISVRKRILRTIKSSLVRWPIQRISMTEKPEPDFQMDIGNKLQSTVSKSAPTTFPLVIQDR